MQFSSTKIIYLGSTAFRQPYATSHCRFIHGYRLKAKFWFTCNTLDKNNWVVDFGGLKQLKSTLEEQFDHTMVVWQEDPELQTFIELNKKGIIDLRIMKDGVGIEKFAQYCLEKGDEVIRTITNGRCWVERVEVWEHEDNSAICSVSNENEVPKTKALQVIKESYTAPQTTPVAEEKQPDPTPKPEEKQRDLGQPGLKTKGYSNLFAGTSWGNGGKGSR